MSQADLSRATGLAPSTVSNLVQRLVADGALATVRIDGRSTGVKLARGADVAVGVDVGHRHITVAVGSRAGRVHAQRRADIGANSSATVAADLMSDLVREALHEAGMGITEPVGIGLGLPTPIDRANLRIAAPSILQAVAPARLNKDGSDPVAFQGLNPQGPEGQIGYTIPNLLVEHAMRATHVPPGFWRGVNNNQNAIWLETFIDEVAKEAGKDPLEFRRAIGNRIYGCDDCQLVCPWNRFARPSVEPDFRARHGLDAPGLLELFGWDEAEFLRRTEGSAIRRIGHERWLRNVAVALGNAPRSSVIATALQARMAHSSVLVREHVAWALAEQAGKPATAA